MKIPFSRYLYFLIPEINSVVLIENEKKEKETEKELIGSLGYIKCIASLSVELSSCYLAFRGMGQDKIPPPHQVRSNDVSRSGLCCPCRSLNLEQGSKRPRLLLRSFFCFLQHEWRDPDQTLDHYILPFQLPFLRFLASPCSQMVPALHYCWGKK